MTLVGILLNYFRYLPRTVFVMGMHWVRRGWLRRYCGHVTAAYPDYAV